MATCSSCGAAPATTESMTGQRVCQACSNTVAGAAAGSLAGGAQQGVVTGVAARNLTGATDADLAYQREMARKVADADGFWRKLKLRIIGSTSNSGISPVVVLPNNHDSPRAHSVSTYRRKQAV